MIRQYDAGTYDVIVIGAGHAGCEAGLAAARMGEKTLMFSINLDSVAMMPCNPSIGGTGKGHLVKEIDALGGEMGVNIDKAMVQVKMLNATKGPAVHSLRAQADKTMYHVEMKKVIEKVDNLSLKQAEVVELIIEDGQVKGCVTATGGRYYARSVVLATGTYLGGKIFIGDAVIPSGPNGLAASVDLTEQLQNLGLVMRRFKTGTPARVNARSLNYENMELQHGDEKRVPFSFMTDSLDFEELPCWLTYTNPGTHDVINGNLERSPMFAGSIEGVGPRYCPSIETKIQRFSDKPRHQLFIEPEGYNTQEMYVQGMSTSLPEDVQMDFMRTIPGLEDCEIMRPAYAIEYDCVDPTTLNLSLEFKHLKNLFSAGQFNGSSGYEEAAAQGLMAGINAVMKNRGKEPFILDRSEAYIGVLIDDLVTKGTNEPYRMMTSRCEYRLVLRQDNADLRLTEKSYNLGLATSERYDRVCEKVSLMEKEMERLKSTLIKAKDLNPVLVEIGSSEVKDSMTIFDLIRRPEITYASLEAVDKDRVVLRDDVIVQCEVEIKYSGYIKKQLSQINKFKAMENRSLPADFDYETIDGLRLEAQQKLNDIHPLNLGQASRISGVSPADINVLLVFLEQRRRRKKENNAK